MRSCTLSVAKRSQLDGMAAQKHGARFAGIHEGVDEQIMFLLDPASGRHSCKLRKVGSMICHLNGQPFFRLDIPIW